MERDRERGERERGKENDLSTAMAARLSIDAVQHMTSSATHVSHMMSPSSHSPPFTCN